MIVKVSARIFTHAFLSFSFSPSLPPLRALAESRMQFGDSLYRASGVIRRLYI